MLNCKPISNSMSPSTKLFACDSTSVKDPFFYQNIVDSLQQLLFTRPDLTFSVNHVYQSMHTPCLSHWQSVNKILQYLKHALDSDLQITPSPIISLVAYTDADWVDCPDDRKLTGGHWVLYGIWSHGVQRSNQLQLDQVRRQNIRPQLMPLVNCCGCNHFYLSQAYF